jgi:hypothetical protein
MANMTSNMEPREQRRPGGNGGPQAESGGTESQAQGTAARAANLAADVATRQVQKTRERIEDRISDQRAQITGRVRALGRALRGAGEIMEEDELAAHALHYASDKVERVAGYVAEVSPDRVADDLRGVARSRPWWFYGGAFALGLVLGRFARSTEGQDMTVPRTPVRSEPRTLPRRPERSGEQWP